MRVLYILNGASGGAAMSAVGLMRALHRLYGVQPCAICHDAGDAQEKQAILDATEGRTHFTNLYWWNHKIRAAAWKRPLIELKQLLETGFLLKSVRETMLYAKKWRAELIHTNTLTNLEGAIAASLLQIPHIWHVRELVGEKGLFRFPVEGQTLLTAMQLLSRRILCNSQTTAAHLSPTHKSANANTKVWSDEKIDIIYNGIDLAPFFAVHDDAVACASTEPTNPQPVRVGMVANLVSRSKQHDLFIQAAAQVKKQCAPVPVHFAIYGHGAEATQDVYVRELFALRTRLSLDRDMQFAGFNPDSAQIMKQIDILVHPAAGESFGRVAAEAMAAGKPVIGVKSGGIGEIVLDGQTGLLAQPNQASSIADCMVRLILDASLRRTLGQQARIHAEKHFHIDACARSVMSVYRP